MSLEVFCEILHSDICTHLTCRSNDKLFILQHLSSQTNRFCDYRVPVFRVSEVALEFIVLKKQCWQSLFSFKSSFNLEKSLWINNIPDLLCSNDTLIFPKNTDKGSWVWFAKPDSIVVNHVQFHNGERVSHIILTRVNRHVKPVFNCPCFPVFPKKKIPSWQEATSGVNSQSKICCVEHFLIKQKNQNK